MIKIQGKIPKSVVLACSGGVDSMAVLDFLYKNHEVAVAYFNHGTEHGIKVGEQLYKVVKEKYPNSYWCPGFINSTDVPKGVSQEEHWRNERYEWFTQLFSKSTVITCHHLDDCVETYLWSCMHGEGKVIPYRNQNVIRPFRLNRKSEFENWCLRHDVPYFDDDSNTDTKYTRNYIRHEMMPHVLRVNPGIHKVVAKKIAAEENIG